MNTDRWGWKAGTMLGGAAMALLSLSVLPATSHAQGVRYSVTGTAAQMNWDGDLGLGNDRFFGLRAGIDFGPLIGLRGHYLWGNDFETEFGGIDLEGPGGALENQGVDVKSIGGDLTLNVLQGSVVPYLLAGAGIMRFDPADAERFDQIYGRVGAGLGFELSRGLRGDVWVANQRMRMDRFDLAPDVEGGYPPDPQADDIRSNWTYNVGLGLDLGRTGASTEGWSVLSFPVEAFVGQLRYDRGGLDDQYLAGLRAGVDMRYVGLRAFYWRGMNDDFDDTQRVQGFGGEAQFNIQAGNGFAPFLVLGGGNLDYKDGFVAEGEDLPSDERFLIAGGGVSLRLSDVVSLNASARDYMISRGAEEDVSQPDDLTHNWLFSAGLGVNIGRDRDSDPVIAQAPLPEAVQGQPMRGGQQQDRPMDRADRTQQVNQTQVDPRTGDRVIQIPVPEQGEIYIRYGESGRLEVTDRTEGESRAQTVVRAAGLTDRQLTELADALAAQLDLPQNRQGEARPRTERSTEAERIADDAELRRIVREELEALGIREQLEAISRSLDEVENRARQDRGERVYVAPDTVRETPELIVTDADDDAGFFGRLSDPVGYFAAALDEPSHMAIGARVDVGRVNGMEALHVVPEVAIGFVNDGTSLLAAGNLEYRFGRLMIGDNFSIRPAVRSGVGLLSVPDAGTEGVLNLIYGFSSGIGDAADGGPGVSWFVEHQGIDLFNRSRIAAGLRWTR